MVHIFLFLFKHGAHMNMTSICTVTPYLASPLCIHKHCFSAVKYALEATTGPSNHHMMRKMYQSYFTHSMVAHLDDSGSVTSIFWKIFEDELRKGKKFRFFMDFIVSTDMLKMDRPAFGS